MNREKPVRRNPRLKGYDYAQAGYYFITICVKDRHELLWDTSVGCDVLIAPDAPPLSEYGNIVNQHIQKINLFCDRVHVDKYTIMPNHIHMILIITQAQDGKCGAMRTSRPTSASLPSVVRSLKTMVTKEIGFSLFQRSYHDHIIRNDLEYQKIWHYIHHNPANWEHDSLYPKKD